MTPCFAGGIAVALALSLCAAARADYTVKVDPSESRGTWEGWGCSLAWWGNGVGGTQYEGVYADLLFTLKPVELLDKRAPGLGLSIVRYNVGGGGDGETVDGATEKRPADVGWFKDIKGFWTRPDPQAWDWNRDANQRSVLKAAVVRGAHVELFANAPMWWMTAEKSSAGGKLEPAMRRIFAHYLAAVAKRATSDWGAKVEYLEPFNEPSAWWWKYPAAQEACPIKMDVQAEILGYLRAELDAQGLRGVRIAASDENTMSEARATYEAFKTRTVAVGSHTVAVSDLVDKVNVHGYYGLQPWRDNKGREALRAAVGTKRLWMSEYGDGDGGGMPLAQTIVEDVNYLRPSAWIYWQPVEPWSGWGFVNARYGDAKDQTAANRAEPTWLYTKYYTFAQFTRFIRPGYRLLGSDDPNSIVAYDPKGKRLAIVTVSYAAPQTITLDLSHLKSVRGAATLTVTNTAGPKALQTNVVPLTGSKLTFPAEANSVYSVVVDGVTL